MRETRTGRRWAWTLAGLLSIAGPTLAAAGEGGAGAGSPVLAGYRESFFLGSEDGNYELRLGGRVTAHDYFYESGSKPRSDLFLTRARLWMEATVWKHYLVRVEGEFAGTPSLRDAYVNVNYTPLANLRVGQFKVPFSLEELYSHRYLDFVERPAVVQSTLKPSRDVGAMLHGKVAGKLVEYQIEVLGGAGQNTRDNNRAEDLAGRIMLGPFSPTDISFLKDLRFGIGATYGDEPSLASSGSLKGNSIGGVTPADFTFYSPVPVRGTRVRLDGQAAWLFGPASVKGEFIHTSEERRGIVIGEEADLDDFETEGWYAAVSCILTGEKETMSRPAPKRPLSGQDGSLGTGLVKIAARYEVFQLDQGSHHAAAEPGPITFRAWTAGLTWYPVSLIRLSADYQREHFSDPARSPRPGHESADVVMARLQAEF